MLSEIRERRGHPNGVIISRDPVRHIVCSDLDERPSVNRADVPCHGHRACEQRVVGFEVDLVYDADTGYEAHEASLDDVGV